MSEFKAGHKVLVLCKVIEPCESLIKVTPSGDDNWFWAGKGQCRPVEPASPSEIPNSSSEPLREAFEADMVKRYDWYQGYFSRNENRYFDSSVEIAWQAFQAGAKYGDPSGGWEPTKDEIEYAMDRCGVPASEPLAVGDAVRFVSPGHKRHGTQGILKSIHHGPKNAYMFVSNCGQFHRYCTIAELEHYDQAETVDVKGSMQSLDGADTIQAGDLQWTDRDGKYRLCNFTIGMRVYQAIERGKAHGEKWVFYRRIRGGAIEANNSLLNEPSNVVAVKRYREPKLSDLANGPIFCESRDHESQDWKSRMLTDVLSGTSHRFLCLNAGANNALRYAQCRIEVGE